MTRAWLDGLEPSEYPPTLYYGPEREPLVFKPEDGGFEGLGGKIPGPDLTVADVARLVGPNRMVDVIGEPTRLLLVTKLIADVATQQSEQWTLEKWAGYVATKFGSNTASASASNPDPTTSKVFNVISLEISGSKLAERVTPPTLVSEIDWVDNCWNFGPGGKTAAMKEEFAKQNAEEAKEAKELKEKSANGVANGQTGKKEPRVKAREPWPKVQLYCLVRSVYVMPAATGANYQMGAKGSWTVCRQPRGEGS
jgi:F-box/leucine-rich repeat protein 10/11